MPDQPRVYIFWDNSNIFISARTVAEQREGIEGRQGVRIQFDHLLDLALAGRRLARAIAVGSIPPELREVWDKLKAPGVDIELYERGQSSGKEQGLDQCLQTHMLRALSDEDVPQIAVLLTGDGAGYDDGVGFHADLERMKKKGWGVEVLAWKRTCRKSLREWADGVGVFVPLEDFYDSITFVEEHRRTSTRVNLRDRRTASPESTPSAAELQEEVRRMRSKAKKEEEQNRQLEDRIRSKDETIKQLKARVRNSEDTRHITKRARQRKKRGHKK